MSYEHLIVEDFLTDALQARALQAALELGVIDVLASAEVASVAEILQGRDVDELGGRFLLQMLAAAGVIELDEQQARLTAEFRQALKFRDLLSTRLQFSQLVATDYFDHMNALLRSTEDFMATAKLFELFDYSRCLEVTTENCMRASRWMQLTTVLTRYEAPVCCDLYDFSVHQHMLDVGGNSGEFSLQVCQRFPELQATVMDLPVVCHVGQRHVSSHVSAGRISFCPGNMLDSPFPEEADLITWKSVLHDWPDQHAATLVQKSFDSLPSGGRLLIFERERCNFQTQNAGYGLLPVLLFFRSYRTADQYSSLLQHAGFCNVTVQTVTLELPFLLITAEKP